MMRISLIKKTINIVGLFLELPRYFKFKILRLSYPNKTLDLFAEAVSRDRHNLVFGHIPEACRHDMNALINASLPVIDFYSHAEIDLMKYVRNQQKILLIKIRDIPDLDSRFPRKLFKLSEYLHDNINNLKSSQELFADYAEIVVEIDKVYAKLESIINELRKS